MKTMTCKQLGGSCDKEFQANSFDEIGQLSKDHAMEMFEKQDVAHLEAMQNMKHLMEDHNALIKWLESKKVEFDNLPED